MNKNKILSILGLCKKSGNLSIGFDSCIESVKQKKSQLILITKDLSEKTMQKLFTQVEKNMVCFTEFSMDDINSMLGKSSGIVSINDSGFANKIKSLLNF